MSGCGRNRLNMRRFAPRSPDSRGEGLRSHVQGPTDFDEQQEITVEENSIQQLSLENDEIHEEQIPSNEGSQEREKPPRRGIYRGKKIENIKRKDGKYPKLVLHGKDDRRPTGAYANLLAKEFTFAIRERAPLVPNVEGKIGSWSAINQASKDIIIQAVKDKFEADWKDPRWNEILNSMAGERYRALRCYCFKHYKSLGGGNLGRAKPYRGLEKRQEEWEKLCDFFDQETFQEKSQRNIKNRSCNPYNHIMGSKSFVQARFEREQNGKKIGEIDTFQMCHEKNGVWVDKTAEEKHAEMVQLKDQSQQAENEKDKLSEIEILSQVLGHKSGYLRGLGHGGPKPKTRTPSTYSCSSENAQQNSHTEERVKTLEDEVTRLKALIAQVPGLESGLSSGMNGLDSSILPPVRPSGMSHINTIQSTQSNPMGQWGMSTPWMMPTGNVAPTFPMGANMSATNTWMGASGVNGFVMGPGGILYQPMQSNGPTLSTQHTGVGGDAGCRGANMEDGCTSGN